MESRCHQDRPDEPRRLGTVMLAVERVHTLCMRSQLTRIPGAPPSGFGRSVRAPRIGITVNPRRHPKAVEPHCHLGRPAESHGPGTVMLAVGGSIRCTCGANSMEYLEHHPVALGEAYAATRTLYRYYCHYHTSTISGSTLLNQPSRAATALLVS